MKILLAILLSISYLFSFDALHVKAEIFSKIAHEFVKKDIVNIYTDDESLRKAKRFIPYLNTTSKEKSDILFLSKIDDLECSCQTKYIFSTSYQTYKTSQKVIGAFFWQKGRPNIIIKSAMLKKLGIKLSPEFEKYVE